MTAPKKIVIKKAEPKNRAAEISAARKAAFHILLAVERGHSHSDDLLRAKAVSALSPADRNLATALVLGVLRGQIQLDRQMHALLSRPDAKLDTEILIALRLGAFQLLQMDRIPAHAAINESVELVKQSGHSFASGMVNAVLRKLAKLQKFEAGDSALEDSGLENSSLNDAALKGHDFSRAVNGSKNVRALAPEKNISEAEQAHPFWMLERWIGFYGEQSAQAICRHGQCQPVLTVRLSAPEVETELETAGLSLDAGEMLTTARTVVSGDVTATVAFREGRVRLQDEGSQLVAEILSIALDQKVKTILDACAAPGGKTLILAERHLQARIVALESSAPRLAQLRKRLAPLGERIECRLADTTALHGEAAYDLALADVPCSGTGTLGRNPEIRHRLHPEDLPRQAERQRAILSAALRALRPGGRAVYSTCSLEPEENEQVITAVLNANPKVRLLALDDCIEALRNNGILTPTGANRLQASLTPEGCLRLLPGAFHTDGFFIAMLQRD